MFTLLALMTGAIWGKPMWGTWWVWDARLTSEAILAFLFLAYILMGQILRDQPSCAKAQACFALIGLIDLPIIHYSVQWWHTLHQGPSIAAGAIDDSMLWPLLLMMLTWFIVGIITVCLHAERLMLENKLKQRWSRL